MLAGMRRGSRSSYTEPVTSFRLLVAATVAGLAAGIGLIGASAATSHVAARTGGGIAIADGTQVRSLLAGVPQHGTVLGRADAPATLVEFADPQCPFCGMWARTTLPVLVRKYVRTGKLRIDFRGLAFLGPDSLTALRAVQAAGLHDRLWTALELLYDNQGVENTGWVTEPLLRLVLDTAGLEPAAVLRQVDEPLVSSRIASAAREAQQLGVPGTPFFRLGPTGRTLTTLTVTSLDPPEFEAAIAKVLGA
jgi:protein-disulfide isomerase